MSRNHPPLNPLPGGSRSQYGRKPRPLPGDDEPWEVVEVTERWKIWYEVRSGALAMTDDGGTPKRYRNLAAARRERDRQNEEDGIRASRTERIVP